MQPLRLSIRPMLITLACLLVHLNNAQANLISNGSFETWTAGLPSGWARTVDPNNGVTATVSSDTGKVGLSAARIHCTAFPPAGSVISTSHADLYQANLALTEGFSYKLSFWAKAAGIDGQTVRVAIIDRLDWGYSPVWQYITPTETWQRFEFSMTITREIQAQHGLLWFTLDEVGTLWIDDVQLIAEPPRLNPRIPSIGSKNTIINSSFELGEAGWSTLGKTAGWGGNLAELVGEIDSTSPAWHGRRSLKIEVGPGKTRELFYDVWPASAVVQNRPLAANLGWMEVQPGVPITFTAYMRANRANVPASLMVRYGSDPSLGGMPGTRSTNVTVGTSWQRYSFTTIVPVKDVFVAAGPDLSATPGGEATLWIDGLQMEVAPAATAYELREPVELGISSRAFGHLFNDGQPPAFTLTAFNSTPDTVQTVVTLSMTDYYGKELPAQSIGFNINPGETAEHELAPSLTAKGFYRARFEWNANGRTHEQTLRFAWLDAFDGADSPFGINHAPGDAPLVEALRGAGVTWARDWSLNRGHLEPVQGQLSFAQSDVQIQRMLDADYNVLALVPLPATNWDSTAPSQVNANTWERMSRMPQDTQRLWDFITAAVNHQASTRPGAIKVWEFLNEPVWTEFCLPNAAYNLPGPSYTPLDYINLLKQAYPVFKAADPDCTVIGGFSAEPWRYAADFINAGGLDYVDIFNLHNYGGLKAPESYISEMVTLRNQMNAAGKLRPIWMTEFSYYGADDLPWTPWVAPASHWAANLLLRDERQCADWSIRNNVIMLAHGVEKIFYHSGTYGEPNVGSWTLEFAMFDAQGQPRKLYAAQTVLANMLGEAPAYAAPFAKPNRVGGRSTSGVYGYAFQCGPRAVMPVWAAETAPNTWGLRVPEGVAIHDLMGNRIDATEARLSESPLYLVSEQLTAQQLATAGTLGEWTEQTGLKLAWSDFK